ncbi:MAG TPA: insulinase family protein [Bacteroidales bacterium]|nr:insulinase family protein [Bacteroidales bacterium]
MKKNVIQLMASLTLILAFTVGYAQKKFSYDTVPNDPLKARIYTLSNGLKVYMTVYKDAPRIQTYVAVRTGSKNDPSDATGLAHYFEHLMFKGTQNYGTTDFEKEKVYLDKIESLFEEYRSTKDSLKRLAIYHVIDSISQVASTYAIPNEYDKLVSLIGATGTNAYTSVDETVYINNIPSNQLENWAQIESDRFKNNVIRIFHTELETVYEEKNMSLSNDQRKIYQAVMEGLFKNHTYGTQTTLGEAEHLKNPSIKKIKEYYNKYYVPNNMAICLSGDLDPDATIKLIDEYFGKLEKRDFTFPVFKAEDPITEPVVKEVVGPDAESIMLAYRFKGAASDEIDILNVIDMILSNRTAGLIDLNLVQKQKVLFASSSLNDMNDYSALILSGKPKEGQTLEEVRDLLLSQLELIKNGEFEDWLIPAVVNELKLNQMKAYENNNRRASAFVSAFIANIPWKNYVEQIDRISKITKQDIISFVNKNITDKNYVVVYKRTGIDKNITKVVKPTITPIKINRTDQSAFYKNIKNNIIKEIEPVFLDYTKDIETIKTTGNIEVLYKNNNENGLFDITFVFDLGNNHDKKWGTALKYLEFLGTSKYTAEELKQEFYKIGCSYRIVPSDEETNIYLSGLTENIDKAFELFESMFSDAIADKTALTNLVSATLKQRKDAKLNKQIIARALQSYGEWGAKGPFKNMLSETELNALSPEELIAKIKSVFNYQHRILYYGSQSKELLKATLEKYHKTPKTFTTIPVSQKFEQQATLKNQVYFVDFTMKQADIYMLYKGGLYDKTMEPTLNLFNEYFGGGMNSLVFQELREARGLAYTARSLYLKPVDLKKAYYSFSYIGTQTDKMQEAINGLLDLMNNMPESDKSFELAKSAIVQQLRTDRTTKASVLYNYERAQKLGLTYDIRKDIYEKVPSLTFADIKAFEEKQLKDKPHTILVLGDKKNIDFTILAKYGDITYLTLEDIFGY